MKGRRFLIAILFIAFLTGCNSNKILEQDSDAAKEISEGMDNKEVNNGDVICKMSIDDLWQPVVKGC